MSNTRILTLNPSDSKKWVELEAVDKKIFALIDAAHIRAENNQTYMRSLQMKYDLSNKISDICNKNATLLVNEDITKLDLSAIELELTQAKELLEQLKNIAEEDKNLLFAPADDLISEAEQLMQAHKAIRLSMSDGFQIKSIEYYNLAQQTKISLSKMTKDDYLKYSKAEQAISERIAIHEKVLMVVSKKLQEIKLELNQPLSIDAVNVQTASASSVNHSASTESSSSQSTQAAAVTMPPPVPPKRVPVAASEAIDVDLSSNTSALFNNTNRANNNAAPQVAPAKPRKRKKGGCSIL